MIQNRGQGFSKTHSILCLKSYSWATSRFGLGPHKSDILHQISQTQNFRKILKSSHGLWDGLIDQISWNTGMVSILNAQDSHHPNFVIKNHLWEIDSGVVGKIQISDNPDDKHRGRIDFGFRKIRKSFTGCMSLRQIEGSAIFCSFPHGFFRLREFCGNRKEPKYSWYAWRTFGSFRFILFPNLQV